MTVSIATISLEEVAHKIGVDLSYALAKNEHTFLRGGSAKERAKLVRELRDNHGKTWKEIASMMGFRSHSCAFSSYAQSKKL